MIQEYQFYRYTVTVVGPECNALRHLLNRTNNFADFTKYRAFITELRIELSRNLLELNCYANLTDDANSALTKRTTKNP